MANIERKPFADILAIPRRKDIEYREKKDYWLLRLAKVGPAPFDLRLLNGMTPPVPEATVRVVKVVVTRNEIRLHLGRVLEVKNWDRKRERPT